MRRTVDVVRIDRWKSDSQKMPDIPEIPAVGELATMLECDELKFKLGAIRSSLLNWINRPNMPSRWVASASTALAKVEDALRRVELAKVAILSSSASVARKGVPPVSERSSTTYPKWVVTEEQHRFIAHLEADRNVAKNALRAAIRAAVAANCDDVLDAIEDVHAGFLEPAFFKTKAAAE